MARNATRRGELPEEAANAFDILRDPRIYLRVGSLEIDGGDQGRATVAGSGKIDAVGAMLLDQPVDVYVDERETRRGAPMP